MCFIFLFLLYFSFSTLLSFELIPFLSLWSIINLDLCKAHTLYIYLLPVTSLSPEEDFIEDIIYDLDLGGWSRSLQPEEV